MKRLISVCLMLALCVFCVSAIAQTYAVRDGDKCALVTSEGSVLLKPGEYAELLSVTENVFAARTKKGAGWQLLDASGVPLGDAVYEDIYADGGMLLFRVGGKYGVMDESLSVIYEPQFSRVVASGEGSFLAIRTDPDDETADGVYLLDGKGGESTTGTTVVYGLNAFSGGLSAAVSPGTKRAGYINAEGVWAISPQYAYASGFVGGLAVASADSGVGVIDASGNWAVSPKYESVALSQGNGVFAATTGGGRVTVYDADTLAIVADVSGGAAYARTERLTDMALVTVGGVSSLYSRGGEVLASWNEEEGASLWSAGNDRMILVSDDEAWLLNGKAEKLAGPYAEVSALDESAFAYADYDGFSGILSADGNVVLQTEYDSIAMAAPGMYIARDASGAYLINAGGDVLLSFTDQEAVG